MDSSDGTSGAWSWQEGKRSQFLKDKGYNERFRVGQRARLQNEYRKSGQTIKSKLGSHLGKFASNWLWVQDKLKKSHFYFPCLGNAYTGFIVKFTRDNTVTKEIIKIIYHWVVVNRLGKISKRWRKAINRATMLRHFLDKFEMLRFLQYQVQIKRRETYQSSQLQRNWKLLRWWENQLINLF